MKEEVNEIDVRCTEIVMIKSRNLNDRRKLIIMTTATSLHVRVVGRVTIAIIIISITTAASQQNKPTGNHISSYAI